MNPIVRDNKIAANAPSFNPFNPLYIKHMVKPTNTQTIARNILAVSAIPSGSNPVVLIIAPNEEPNEPKVTAQECPNKAVMVAIIGLNFKPIKRGAATATGVPKPQTP